VRMDRGSVRRISARRWGDSGGRALVAPDLCCYNETKARPEAGLGSLCLFEVGVQGGAMCAH
jgi:hypothetical protein